MILYPPLGTAPFVQTQGPHTAHQAIDWDAPDGSPLFASHPGRLTTRVSVTAGNVIEISGQGHFSEYFHAQDDEWYRRPSRTVRQGERIGTMGSSGSISTGPHLHYAINVDGVWTFPGSLDYSTDTQAPEVPNVATAIVLGQLKRQSPFVVDVPAGVTVFESPGVPLYVTKAPIALDYFGNPKRNIDHAVVEVKTQKVTGRLEWVLCYVLDADVGKPRRK